MEAQFMYIHLLMYNYILLESIKQNHGLLPAVAVMNTYTHSMRGLRSNSYVSSQKSRDTL